MNGKIPKRFELKLDTTLDMARVDGHYLRAAAAELIAMADEYEAMVANGETVIAVFGYSLAKTNEKVWREEGRSIKKFTLHTFIEHVKN